LATRNRAGARRATTVARTTGGVVRVALYTRRSTDDEHQPFSIDAQDTRLDAYVASQPGWQIVDRFTDDASGATLDRPGLHRALQAARTSRFDLLLVYRLDRLTRRIRDLATLMDDLDRAGVHFRSATEPFDTSTPAGRMLVQMLGVFAEFEREIIIDRVRGGMERKAARGKWTGGPIPYGYRLDKAADALTADPVEAPLVRQMFTAYADARQGTRAIATGLNQRGIRTRSGKPWSGYTIGRILANRVYAGEKVFGDITVPDAHPAMVDPNLFQEVQRILALRGAPGAKRAAVSSDYDLTGLITCPDCGLKYVGSNAHGRTRIYRYYTCFAKVRYGAHGCQGPRINADHLEHAVAEALTDLYANTALITDAIARERQHRTEHHHTHRAELAGVDQQLATIHAAIARYQTAFETGTLNPDAFADRIRDLHAQAAQLEHRRHDLTATVNTQPAAPSQQAIDAIRRNLVHVLRHGTPGQRKAAIETGVAEIKIDGDQIIPIFKIPTQPDHDGADAAVRAMTPMVGRRGLEPEPEEGGAGDVKSAFDMGWRADDGADRGVLHAGHHDRRRAQPAGPAAQATRRGGWAAGRATHGRRAALLPSFRPAAVATGRLAPHRGLTEKKMLGGLAMLPQGNMAVGVHGEALIVRTDPGQPEQLLGEPGVRGFDLTGRPMNGGQVAADSVGGEHGRQCRAGAVDQPDVSPAVWAPAQSHGWEATRATCPGSALSWCAAVAAARREGGQPPHRPHARAEPGDGPSRTSPLGLIGRVA
jgi:site-specific DNA recombinase